MTKQKENNNIFYGSTDDEGGHSDAEVSHNKSGQNQIEKAEAKATKKLKRDRIRLTKRYGLLVFWVFSAVIFMVFEEKHLLEKTLEVPQERGKS